MKRFLGIAAVLILSTQPLWADTTPAGYRIAGTQPISDVFATYATLTNGNVA